MGHVGFFGKWLILCSMDCASIANLRNRFTGSSASSSEPASEAGTSGTSASGAAATGAAAA